MKNKKVVFAIIFSACSLLSALFASQQPSTPKNSWFTELAGDWAIKIGQTDYYIGNSLDSDFPHAYRIGVPILSPTQDKGEKYVNKLLVDGITKYLFFNSWILTEGHKGWCLIDTNTGTYSQAPSVQELQNIVNEDVSSKAINMIVPHPSYRNRLFLVAIALMALAALLFASQIPFKKKTDDIVIRKHVKLL
ncbi:MAG: hypothetical protein K9M75_10675 [Phycisphaerae bacterium]|nr:hypothetical protein [Phycisphaerae bacterium]